MRSLGHHRWLYNIPFPPSPVFSCPSCVNKTKSIPVHSLILSSHLFLFFFALCLAEPSLLSQKTLRCGQTTLISVSWPRSGLRYVFQWLPGSFFELPHWWHGPCMRCSVTFRSISSRRPASFSLGLPSRSVTHRRTEIWIWQRSASVSRLVQEICYFFFELAFALSELQWLVKSTRAPRFEPSSEAITPRYLKLVTASSFYHVPLISLWMHARHLFCPVIATEKTIIL